MMTANKVLSTMATVLFIVVAQGAFAETITFENTAPAGQFIFGTQSTYSEAGYTISNLLPSLHAYVSPNASTNGLPFGPSAFGPLSNSTFLGFCSDCGFSLNQSNNQLFSLSSLDIGLGDFGATSGAFVFTGQRGDSTTFTYEFALGDFAWHHLSFADNADFSSLKSLSIKVTGPTSIGIDNINVSPVPVPAAAWLFGSGLLGLAGARSKRRLSRI